MPFVRPAISEAGLAGTAMLAGLATGRFGSPREAVEAFVHIERCFEPDPRRHAIYQERVQLYRRLFPSLHPVLKAL